VTTRGTRYRRWSSRTQRYPGFRFVVIERHLITHDWKKKWMN